MKYIHTSVLAIVSLICAQVVTAETNDTVDPFQEVAASYRAANPQPRLPEDAHKFKVQAEFAVQEKQFDKAVELYGKALEIAPWWPEGHFNRALILGETEKYRDAMREMKRYLILMPDAPDARAAQDKIYQWESAAPDSEEIKKYAWLLGQWNVAGSWFSKAPFDYGERHNSFQAEFSKSGSGLKGM
jgi:tetratricopeptide (TPR) repeat protein